MKFLKKNNVPIVIVMAETAMDSGKDALSFKAFINDFANGIYPAYEEASGSGNVKASKVQQRLRVMYLALCSYYKMKPSEDDKPFAREIPLYLEGSAVDDLVGGAEPISGTTEWAGKSFGETGSVSETSDRSLGDIGFVSETAESESGSGTEPDCETELGSETEPAEDSIGEQSPAENSEVNQYDSSSDDQSEESTENSDEVLQPCSGVEEQKERDADE